MNGTCPDSIWYMTTPSEYTSERVSPRSPHPLFRRHVERCSPLCASLCHRQHVRGVRYPEVDQLNHAVRVKRRQQHVLGLDVVVSDAMPAGARRFEREGRLMREGDGSAYIQRSSVNKLADRVRDVLYNQEVGTVVLADVDDARNVRMIDGTRLSELHAESARQFRALPSADAAPSTRPRVRDRDHTRDRLYPGCQTPDF